MMPQGTLMKLWSDHWHLNTAALVGIAMQYQNHKHAVLFAFCPSTTKNTA